MTTLDRKPFPPARRSLDVFFSESVRRYPDRSALVVHGRSWSYRELDAECASIEAVLREAGLIGKASSIGVVYAKGVLSYAAVISIMRTNNVYVPLNSRMPADRL